MRKDLMILIAAKFEKFKFRKEDSVTETCFKVFLNDLDEGLRLSDMDRVIAALKELSRYEADLYFLNVPVHLFVKYEKLRKDVYNMLRG